MISRIKKSLSSLIGFFSKKYEGAKEIIKEGDTKVMASFFVMGLGQLLYKQWIKGFIYLALAFNILMLT